MLAGSCSAKRSASHSSKERRFSHNDFCFSRVSPLQKQRIEQVEMIEQALKKHPLALYPHLEECVPPEVLSNMSLSLKPNIFVYLSKLTCNYHLNMSVGFQNLYKNKKLAFIE